MAGVLSSLSATVVDIVGAAPMVGEGWFDRRAVVALAGAEPLTSGWFTDIRVATRAPGLRSPAVVGASSRRERFAAAAVTYPSAPGLPSSWSSPRWVVGLSPDRLSPACSPVAPGGTPGARSPTVPGALSRGSTPPPGLTGPAAPKVNSPPGQGEPARPWVPERPAIAGIHDAHHPAGDRSTAAATTGGRQRRQQQPHPGSTPHGDHPPIAAIAATRNGCTPQPLVKRPVEAPSGADNRCLTDTTSGEHRKLAPHGGEHRWKPPRG